MHPSPTLTDLAGFTGIRITTLCCALLLAGPASTFAQAPQPEASRPVGIRRVEYIDAHHSGRHPALSVFYPAAVHDRSATPFVMPFFANLHPTRMPRWRSTG